MQRFLKPFADALTLLLAAYIPIGLMGLEGRMSEAIGCAAVSKCYAEGAEVLDWLFFWAVYSAVLIWPFCIANVWRFLKTMLQRRSLAPTSRSNP